MAALLRRRGPAPARVAAREAQCLPPASLSRSSIACAIPIPCGLTGLARNIRRLPAMRDGRISVQVAERSEAADTESQVSAMNWTPFASSSVRAGETSDTRIAEALPCLEWKADRLVLRLRTSGLRSAFQFAVRHFTLRQSQDVAIPRHCTFGVPRRIVMKSTRSTCTTGDATTFPRIFRRRTRAHRRREKSLPDVSK